MIKHARAFCRSIQKIEEKDLNSSTMRSTLLTSKLYLVDCSEINKLCVLFIEAMIISYFFVCFFVFSDTSSFRFVRS